MTRKPTTVYHLRTFISVGVLIIKWLFGWTSVNISRFFKMSPFVNDLNPGINPGSGYL